MTKRFILLCCLFINAVILQAQPSNTGEPVYRRYTNVNAALPSNTIYRLATDEYGYIWMATERGMVRYDGSQFRLFLAPGIDNEFVHTYKPVDSLLWLFSYSGDRIALNLHSQHFVFSDTASADPARRSPVILAYQQADTMSMYRVNGVYTQSIPASSLNPVVHTGNIFLHQLVSDWQLPVIKDQAQFRAMSSLFEQKPYAVQLEGSTLIIGNKIFRRQPGAEASFIFNGDDWNVTANISSYTRRGDDMYLGFLENRKLIVFPGYFGNSLNSIKPVQKTILNHAAVTSLLTDYQGNLWVATLGEGLYLFTAADLTMQHYVQQQDGMNVDYVSGISSLEGGLTAIGYPLTKIAILYKGIIRQVAQLAGDDLNEIRTVYKKKDHWFFFGSRQSYVSKGLHQPGKLETLPVSRHNPFKDGYQLDNRFYFSTKSFNYCIDSNNRITADTRYKGSNTLTLCPVDDKTCYYGTTSGIYRNNTSLPFLRRSRINKVRVINDKLFICTQEGVFFIPTDRDTDKDALVRISNKASYDIKAGNGYAYIRTAESIMLVSLKDGAVKNNVDFTKYPFAINDFIIEKDTLLLATGSGVISIPVRSVDADTAISAPAIYITSSLNEFNPAETSGHTIFSKKLVVTLQLNILDYKNEPKLVNYQLNYNGEEITNFLPAENNMISLNNLKPGNYIVLFNVKSMHAGWQKTITYHLHISPLWYQRTWVKWLFWVTVTAITATLLWIIYRLQLRKAQQKLNDQLRMNELESKNLFAQLKPHFIFNVLTPLQSYFINGDDIGGLKYIDNYARLMRGLLQESRESFISLEKETEFLQHYLFIQQQRFNNSFNYRIDIDAAVSTMHTFVPTLMLQPIVENAIEHGLRGNDSKNGFIWIRISQQEGMISIEIKDNGKGFPDDKPVIQPGHALEIIHERLALTRKKFQKGTMTISNNTPEPGTTVTIQLPVFTKNMNE